MAYSLYSIEPVALDVIKITYTTPVVTGPEFYDVARYVVYYGEVNPNNTTLPVKLIINKNKQSTATELLLCIPGIQDGATYSVVCLPQKQVNGVFNSSNLVGKFVATRTKLDSLLMLIPAIYDKSYTSNIRSLLTSIALQLDDVGGPNKECYV